MKKVSKLDEYLFDLNGYLIIENFKTNEECEQLINRSKELIDEQDFNNQQSIFDTVSQNHNDNYTQKVESKKNNVKEAKDRGPLQPIVDIVPDNLFKSLF